MKNGFMLTAAAAVLAGAMVVGCDKSKSEADKAAEPTHAAPDGMSGATPATPDKKMDSAMKDMGSQMKDMGDKAKDAGKSASDAMSAGMDKMKDKMGGGAATQPAMPAMPSMK